MTDKTHRVYIGKCGSKTFFKKEGNDYRCTHGGWLGSPIGESNLKHVHGIAKYVSHEDLTKEQHDERGYT